MRKDWIEIELGELFETVTGNTPSKKDPLNYGSDMPLIKPPELKNKPISNAEDYLSETGASKARILPKGSVLVTCIGNLGRAGIARYPVSFNQQINAIKPIEGIDSKFTFYQCQNPFFRRDLERLSSATTVAIVNKGKFNSIRVKLAPLPEQRAIVSKIEQLFSELDNGISNLHAAKDKLEIYHQAVLKKAFEGEFNNAKIEWVKLGEVCEKVEYGTSRKSDKNGKIPVIRMGNIQNGRIEWNDLKFTSEVDDIEKYRLYKNDVLFNRTNSPEHVGKTAIFKGKKIAIFAGYLIRIHYHKEFVNGDYLNYFLNCHVAKKHGNKVKSFGVNQSNINGTKLKQYPFPKTSLIEQNQIVEEIESRLSVCDNVLANIEEGLEKSEALRQSILKKAFEGKLLSEEELAACRKEPDWEPAGKLLERIKNDKAVKA